MCTSVVLYSFRKDMCDGSFRAIDAITGFDRELLCFAVGDKNLPEKL